MSYYTSFTPVNKEAAMEILAYILTLDIHFIRAYKQTNRHEIEDYVSVEVEWLNGEEYEELDDAEDELTPEQKIQYDALDKELDVLHDLEEKVHKKYEKVL